jgi:isopropylmalate/homocitrate/citramalate synthase
VISIVTEIGKQQEDLIMSDKKETWRTENWWVSPWDFMEEVRKEFKPAKQIKVHDVTLRDGEQQAGIIFTKDEKIGLAEELAALGVSRIEPGMPVVSAEDEAAVKEIVKRKLGPEIFAGCRSVVDEIKRAADCGVTGVTIGTPASRHLIEQGVGWPLERAAEHAIKATLTAKELGLHVLFFPIDGSRADMEWYFSFIERVARDGHIDSLVVSDTFGVLTPQSASYLIKRLKEKFNIPLECHFHNHFGMAVANTAAAVMSGADAIHTAVTGIGEGSGNCCMEEVVVALLALYGIDVGVNYERLYGIAKRVGELAGTPANRPFVGDRTFTLETGEGVLFYRHTWPANPTVFFPILPKVVGHPDPEIVLGKKSGIDAVELWAEKMSIELTKEEAREIVARVKKRAVDLRRLITEEEFREMVRSVKG